MNRKHAIIAAGVALTVGLIVKLPASVFLNWVLPDDVQTSGITGTAWSGQIAAVRVRGFDAGPIEWSIKPASLLFGALRTDINAEITGGFASADVTLRMSSIRVRDGKIALDLAPVTRLSSIGPTTGRAQMTINDATFEANWPVAVDGAMVLNNLQYSGLGDATLGNYQLTFLPDLATDQFPVVAELESLDGSPYELDGTVSLGAERSYSIEAGIKASGSANTGYARQLAILGPANADGVHQMSYTGSL